MSEIYLGNPPEAIRQWILAHWDGSDSSDSSFSDSSFSDSSFSDSSDSND